jgi:hypothetical protein
MNAPAADSLTLLLTRLFDYAGMFPPAGRSFEEALRESASFPTSLRRPWMLGSDLVLDAEHTAKLLNTDLRSFGFSRNISICFLATDTPQQCLETATKLISRKRKDGLVVTISSVEAKVSMEGLPTVIDLFLPFTQKCSTLLAVEPDLSTTHWTTNLKSTVEAIQGRAIALKCRCTGPTGIGPDRLAVAVAAACDHRLPMKVTGGLHHPIVESARYDNRMGFLNLAAAVALRRARGSELTQEKIIALLTNSDFDSITCGTTLGYDHVLATYDEVVRATSSAVFAIGSCSLHEPDADITRLTQ